MLVWRHYYWRKDYWRMQKGALMVFEEKKPPHQGEAFVARIPSLVLTNVLSKGSWDPFP